MQTFYALNKAYLEYFPPLMVFLTGIGVAAWAWWSKQKSASIGDNALTSVSGAYKLLSDSQQSGITQRDKLVGELQTQLKDAYTEISRLRDLIESMRAVKSINDANTIRSLVDSEGGG